MENNLSEIRALMEKQKEAEKQGNEQEARQLDNKIAPLLRKIGRGNAEAEALMKEFGWWY